MTVSEYRRRSRRTSGSGSDVTLGKFLNLYGCSIGDETKIGAFVEIQKNATVGRRCKISSHTFICEGVTIEDHAFIGHGVMFINDSYPRATTRDGELQTEQDWKVEPTLVRKGASIGSGATILSNVVIGEHAIVGAGSVVTRDVPPHAIVAGNPARVLRILTTESRELRMISHHVHAETDVADIRAARGRVDIEPRARRRTRRRECRACCRDRLRLLGSEHRPKLPQPREARRSSPSATRARPRSGAPDALYPGFS